MQLNTYLMFNGTCADAFRFYEQCFNGKLMVQTYGESEMASQTPPALRDKVMHAHLHAEGADLMGSDSPAQYEKPMGGFAVSANVKTADEAERVFKALSDGGQVTMPLQETFWSPRFGMLTDKFGVPWMVNCEGQAAERP